MHEFGKHTRFQPVRLHKLFAYIAQVAREMAKRDRDVMGLSETHWTGQGKTQLQSGETIIYTVRDDDTHRRGVGILMSKTVTRALMDWSPVSERIIKESK